MKKTLCALSLGALAAAPALAAGLSVTVTVPRLNVAEYHRPYIAVWIEPADAKAQTPGLPATLAVWYDQKEVNGEVRGTKWLKDMRQWWRRTGRELTLPIDGVSGATRPSGEHTLDFTAGQAPLPDLPAGNYKLLVEASREVGGREVVTVPFAWPPKAAASASANGESELGAVKVQLKP